MKTLEGTELKKIKSFALLPLFFTKAVLDLKSHEPRDYLFSFIKLIQLGLRSAEKENAKDKLDRLD